MTSGPAPLRPLCLPLAGSTSARGPLGVQSLGGLSLLLVNEPSGSTVAWCVYDTCDAPLILGYRSAQVEAAVASLRETLATYGGEPVAAFLTLSQLRRMAA